MHTLCTHFLYMHTMYIDTFTYDRLLLIRTVSSTHDSSAVLLTDPAQVAHRLHHHYMREKLTPELGEGGVSHCPHHTGCCCVEIQLPDGVLGGAGREELDVGALVPGYSSRQQHGIGIWYMYM